MAVNSVCITKCGRHPRSERRAHPLRFGPSDLARLALKDSDEFVRPHVAFVLGPFFLRELTFGRFGGQIFDPTLKLRVCLKTYCIGLSSCMKARS